MIKRKAIDNHEIKRNLFGIVTIDGQKTPLRFGEAVKALSTSICDGCAVWERQSQEWKPIVA